jgi:hypothetical protein
MFDKTKYLTPGLINFFEYWEKKKGWNPTNVACVNCKFMGDLPGDAHKCCTYFGAGERIVMGLMKPKVRLTGPGIDMEIAFAEGNWDFNQYFVWPINFDPQWLVYCLLYEGKENHA